MCKEQALEMVLSEFMKIAQIPRPSHHEERISEYLYQWAVQRKLPAKRDSMNTVIIDKPASPGCEGVPRVIFQAHMDMVCVAQEGVAYQPLVDPIKVLNDGVNLSAKGTSLGADDGIGVAMCLYLLQDETLRHGPIRAIFTTNEEDGMDSVHLDAKYLDGGYLVNLDWETIGSLCNSCAGGDFFNFWHKADWEAAPADSATVIVRLGGLLGGHSGVGINKGYANALVSMATALSMLRQSGVPFRVASFTGGQAKNAIPAYATAQVSIAAGDAEKAKALLEDFRSQFMDDFGNIEKEAALQVEVRPVAPKRILGESCGYAMVDLMTSVPNNVHTMSPFIDGLVESSSNLGTLAMDDDRIFFTVFARSSVAYQATQLGVICAALARGFGYDFESEGHVPGWAVNPNSKLIQIACQAYRELTGEEMVVEPVHAGVECGAFSAKNPGLDMIAIGPTLLDVHTPDETCCIANVKTITELLVAILEKIAA